MSVDPLVRSYPWNSPYAFSENSPIAFIELEGLEKAVPPLTSVNLKQAAEDLHSLGFGRAVESPRLTYMYKGLPQKKKEKEKFLGEHPVMWTIAYDSYFQSSANQNKGLRLTRGTPAQALRELNVTNDMNMDCAMHAQAVILYAAMLEMNDDEEFNKLFVKNGRYDFKIDFYESSNIISTSFIKRDAKGNYFDLTDPKKVVQIQKTQKELLNEAAVGTRIAFTTDDPNLKDGNWRNENVVKVGDNMYSAHDFGVVTYEQLMEGLSKLSSTGYYVSEVESYTVNVNK